MTKEDIARVLKTIRLQHGMTQREAAEKIGRKQQTLASWEIGQSQPDANTLFVLCEIYGTTIDDAFGFTKKKPHATNNAATGDLWKYDYLDSYGKASVLAVMDVEYRRCTDVPQESSTVSNTDTISLLISTQSAAAGTGTYLGVESFETVQVIRNELTSRGKFCVSVKGDSMEPVYFEDQILIVSNEDLEVGDIGIFTMNGNGYVKKLGHGELVSLNPSYDPISIDENMISNGKVVGVLDSDWIIEQ